MNRRALWRRLRDERGQATLEAILVVPLVLVPVLFGVVTFGELEHTRLVLDAAAAAGARQAAVDGQDDQAVRDRIDSRTAATADSIPRRHRSA